MLPSSSLAWSLKPSVAYLDLNFCALWKKQTTLPSLAYAGIPYQVLGESAGALALTSAWIRLAIVRSGSAISAIFASTSLSPSALPPRSPRRASVSTSRARSFIAARSSSVKRLDFFAAIAVLLVDSSAFFMLTETSRCRISLRLLLSYREWPIAITRNTACLWNVLGVKRRDNPTVHSRFINRDARWRKAWIGERADGDRHEFFQSSRLVVDRRSAARAEMKLGARAFVADADIFG